MAETVNQETNGTETESQVKTFTQDEVNAIVADRLSRERAKYTDYDDLKDKASKYAEFEESQKTELQKATEKAQKFEAELKEIKRANELKAIREKVSTETNVPTHLLTAETEEDCLAQAKAIIEYAKPNAYPTLKDSGEVNNMSGTSAADMFADWFNQTMGNKN